MTTGIDGDLDHCAVYRRLRDALVRVAMGESVRGIRYRNGEEERQTDFSPADVGELRRLVAEAKAACEASISGGRRPPSVIRFSTSKGF